MGVIYCYYIESTGSYLTENLKDPLLNKSQEICIEPIDEVAPCNPDLTVSNDCDEFGGAWEYVNILTWFVSSECLEDVQGYRLYFKGFADTDYELIFETNDPSVVTFVHELSENSLTGCYKVSAFDGFNNESDPINEVCIDPCFIYELPNTFTPNDDFMNDVFVPIEGYKFVSKVDFKVFNRWGNLLFETNDPDLNWTGIDQNSEDALPTGVYYYTLDVIEEIGSFRQTLGSLSGYIHLIRE